MQKHKKKRYVHPCRNVDAEQETDESPLHFDALVEEFLLRTRRILVVGTIDEELSTRICSYLQLYSTTGKPIYMYINSLGGCVSSGYAIVDQMSMCNCPIYTIVRGNAYSMGAIIAAFGDKKHRYATPNSSMMLHSVIINSSPESIEKHGRMTSYIQDDYNKKIQSLARKMKLGKKKLKELMNETRWMSTQQAMSIGLIDAVWTPRMEREVNKGSWE
jgi:ATP-dependent Clp protease protease subunit